MSAEEQISTQTPSETAAVDEARSEKILKVKELYNRGSRNFLVKSYADAADELSEVCALYEELYGELSDELGMPYLLYAKSLIALALDENKVIDVPDEEDDEESETEGQEDKDEKKEANGKAEKNGSSGGDSNKENEADSTIEDKTAKKPTEEKENKDVDSSKEKKEELVSSSDGAKDAKLKNGTANGSKHEHEPSDDDKPSTSNGAGTDENVVDEEDEEDQETASNLQLAWEILELASKIFSRQGLSGLPNLAEVKTELGNVEFENSILDGAREDYEKALKIYGELSSDDYRRAMAELHYKIGITYIMQQLNKQGSASFKEACTLIDSEIAAIKAKPTLSEKDNNNVEDLEETKQEILLKITEIEETQAQTVAQVRAALDNFIKPQLSHVNDSDAGPSSSSSSKLASSGGPTVSSSKPTDISHLIKRKKPDDVPVDEAAEESPAKRPPPM